MKYKPHEYQSFATNFVLEHPACGLILDMGLGKSVVTLTALWSLLLDSFDVGTSTFQSMIIRTTLSKLVMCSDLSFLSKIYCKQ